jgi:hypothetical protein
MPNLRSASVVPWSEQKAVASDGNAREWLGSWVAVEGTTALVAAKNATVDGHPSQGCVYVFRRTAGVWKQVQKLVSSDGGPGDLFGSAIAIHGKRALIAAPNATVNGKLWQGAVYVFWLVGGTWVQKQKLVAGHGQALDTFGTAVAMNSGSVFIGAGGASSAGVFTPRVVYVFRPEDPTARQPVWVERQTLDAPDPADKTSFFGATMAASDSVALIGARASKVGTKIGQGVVYVYTESSGSWGLAAKLMASDGAARDNFGVSIAVEGKTALIGSPGASIKGNVSQGAVYRFSGELADWTEVQKFSASDGTAANLFGASVNLSNGIALVGAYAMDNYRGAAYVFKRDTNGVFLQLMKLVASDGVAGDVFGYYTALGEKAAVVGAYTANIGANHQQGAVYFFNRPEFSDAGGA